MKLFLKSICLSALSLLVIHCGSHGESPTKTQSSGSLNSSSEVLYPSSSSVVYNNGAPKLVINEFMARNNGLLGGFFTDDSGYYSDWIELYNASNQTVNLSEFYLLDANDFDSLFQDTLGKYQLRDTLLAPGAHYVAYASDKTIRGTDHIKIRLSYTCGDALFLIWGGDSTVVDSISFRFGSDIYQALYTNESYGRLSDGASEWGIQSPVATPRQSNSGRPVSPSDLNRELRVCVP